MRKILCAVVLLLSVLSLKGQTISDDEYMGNRWINEWQSAFSAEGRKSWKPEITARAKVGIYTGGQNLSIGARVDDKCTLGLMLGNAHAYIDAAPGDIYAFQTAAYMLGIFISGSVMSLLCTAIWLSVRHGCIK